MKKYLLVAFILFLSSTGFTVEVSREAAKLVAISYLSGENKVSSQEFKEQINEIVVNDQKGTSCYDVEVEMVDEKKFKSAVLTLSELNVVANQNNIVDKTFDAVNCMYKDK